ncbi:MAG: nucleoside triphosphate pyrophosphohydrolase [Myxococcales bacterium]|nr:nucleoside triphosphate pyrophosphohydrolase [Myxococcales bacterium]
MTKRSEPGFSRLITVMARLRDPDDGCPWDLEQSLASLKPYLVEECYEALDAVDALGDAALATQAPVGEVDPALVKAHRDELGDVLLQVAFQSRLAEEFEWFTADDVAHSIADKMVRRHPHVFSDTSSAQTADEVMVQWQQIKARESKTDTSEQRKSVLAGVPRQLPALLRAQRIGSKAAHTGFDWPGVPGAVGKVDEELAELKEALASGDPKAIESELGDLLFAATSVARHAGVDAEQALRKTLDRFAGRFAHVEEKLAETDGPQDSETLERWWQAAKRKQAPIER